LGPIFPCSDGGNVLGGGFDSNTGWGFYICKEDAGGNIVWSKAYSKGNGSILRTVIQTSDGGYIMAGESNYTDSNVLVHYGSFMDADIWVLKLDSLGNKIWSKAIGGTADERVASIVEIPGAKSYYIIGATASNDYDCTGNHGQYDAYVARLDSNGNIIWHKDLGGTGGDAATFAVADGKGGAILAVDASSTDGDITHPLTSEFFWVLDIDSSGTIVWDNSYGGGGGDCYPNAICKATDGSIWIAGVTSKQYGQIDTAYGRDDAWFVHADSVGNFLSARVMGSHLWDEGQMIYPLPNGAVIAGGFYDTACADISNSWYGEEDAFLVTFSPWPEDVKTSPGLSKGEVTVWPNPAKEGLTLSFSEGEGTAQVFPADVKIYNIVGQKMYSGMMLENKMNIDISGFCSGVYFVEVNDEYNNKKMVKVIKE